MKAYNYLLTIAMAVVITIAMSGNALSQSLQFSQVKLVTTQETVPAGTVWKIESVIYNIPLDNGSPQYSTSTNCGVFQYRSAAIIINGIPTKVGSGSQPASYSNIEYMHSYTSLPIWLPAGSTLSGGPCNNQVSLIEFSVVP